MAWVSFLVGRTKQDIIIERINLLFWLPFSLSGLVPFSVINTVRQNKNFQTHETRHTDRTSVVGVSLKVSSGCSAVVRPSLHLSAIMSSRTKSLRLGSQSTPKLPWIGAASPS